MNAVLVLQARAEARAMLFRSAEFDLEEALAPLLEYAIDSGVVEAIGSEAASSIIRDAFKGIAEI